MQFFCNLAANSLTMYHQRLSDKRIIEGFRRGDADIFREYFYGYCRTGYYVFDQRYQLSESFAGGQSEDMDYQRVPLRGARCAEMVPPGIRDDHL